MAARPIAPWIPRVLRRNGGKVRNVMKLKDKKILCQTKLQFYVLGHPERPCGPSCLLARGKQGGEQDALLLIDDISG
jgi:hypothetical protein